ncbi:transposase [Actinomadura sp. LCR2-06]|uniref:Transposase n=1 Tax=Actinomadura violacea TaxID=2819934 RepID=A0ABS3S2C9_9ACTN|nr:transposase [Actinomadura violacea]
MAAGGSTAADLGAWICFEDETGQGLRPPKGRTWSRRGHRPQVKVHGGEHGSPVSVVGLVCYRAGERSRLIYRLHLYRRSKGERAAFTLNEDKSMLQGAHQQLPDGKIVLIWDNLGIHHSTAMRAFIDAHADWLTVFYLPVYAPDLNPHAAGRAGNRRSGRLRRSARRKHARGRQSCGPPRVRSAGSSQTSRSGRPHSRGGAPAGADPGRGRGSPARYPPSGRDRPDLAGRPDPTAGR